MSADRLLTREDWYHGLLPREDLKEMMKKNGDFLVRTTEPVAGQARAFVLSIMLNAPLEEQGMKHYVIKKLLDGRVLIDKQVFGSVSELVRHHHSQGTPVATTGDNAILKTPVVRQGWELAHDDIQLTKKLGEGAFGEVHAGSLALKNGRRVPVAVKLAKLEAMTKEQLKEFMREARLMRPLNHQNIVKLYGVAAGAEPLMMLMELCNCGALDSYLKKTNVPMETKNQMILEAAWGIEYLHKQNLIHRDIAARNCLYGDELIKIADFGLTRVGTVYQMDPHKRVPIRWLAPETIKMAMYSQKTDVFSYGIMVWEIYNNGAEPYPGMTVAEVHSKIKEGYRMTLPTNVQIDINKIIVQHCWAENVNDRYNMDQVVKHLQRALPNAKPLRERLPPPAPPPTESQPVSAESSENVRSSTLKKKQSKTGLFSKMSKIINPFYKCKDDSERYIDKDQPEDEQKLYRSTPQRRTYR